MDKRKEIKKARSKDVLLDILAKHSAPKTDIYDQMKAVAKQQGVLQKVKVTPDVAKDLLVLNTKNRMPITDSWKHVVKEMSEDKWKFTGDTIKVSDIPTLLDGQHTLIGVAMSGKTQYLNIQTGLDPDVFDVIDVGRNRNAADIISMEGYDSYQTTIASSIKSVIYFTESGRMAANISRNKVTNEEVTAWVRKNKLNMPLMLRSCDYAVRELYKKSRVLSIGTWAFVYYILRKVDEADAKRFVDMLASEENLSSTNKHAAIYKLMKILRDFERIIAFSTKLERGGSKPVELKVRYVFRAWNLWRSGVKLEGPLRLIDRVDREGFRIEKPV